MDKFGEAAGKLVDLVSNGIKFAGGEAARLYPEIIKLYVIERVTWAVICLIGVTIGWYVWFQLFKLARKYHKKESNKTYYDRDDVGMVAGITAACAAALPMIVFSAVTSNAILQAIRVIAAPEAAFVMDHIQKLMK